MGAGRRVLQCAFGAEAAGPHTGREWTIQDVWKRVVCILASSSALLWGLNGPVNKQLRKLPKTNRKMMKDVRTKMASLDTHPMSAIHAMASSCCHFALWPWPCSLVPVGPRALCCQKLPIFGCFRGTSALYSTLIALGWLSNVSKSFSGVESLLWFVLSALLQSWHPAEMNCLEHMDTWKFSLNLALMKHQPSSDWPKPLGVFSNQTSKPHLAGRCSILGCTYLLIESAWWLLHMKFDVTH